MTSAQLVEAVCAGTLPDSSLVWRIGMHDWSKLCDVPQLQLALGAQTPGPSRTQRAIQPLAPLAAQAESRRRLDTMPFGFPVVRAPAPPAAPAPRMVPPPKPVERKAHASTLEAEPVQSRISHSLIPTSSDASRAPSSALAARVSTPSASGDEIRPQPFKRVALWAAAGVIAASALVAIWTLKNSQPELAKQSRDDRAPAVMTPTVATAAPAPPVSAAPNAPSSSSEPAATAPAKPASSATRLPARRVPARLAKPIPVPAAEAPSEASSAHEESAQPGNVASSASAPPPEPADAAPSAAMPKPESPPATLDPLVPSNF